MICVVLGSYYFNYFIKLSFNFKECIPRREGKREAQVLQKICLV